MDFAAQNAITRRDFFLQAATRKPGKVGWYEWVFDQAISRQGIKEDMPVIHIADVGGGDGGLWKFNPLRVPPTWKITVLENTRTVAEMTRAELGHLRFDMSFAAADTESAVQYDVKWLREQIRHSLHAVFALHVLQARQDPNLLLDAARDAMRSNGVMFVSLPGENDLREVQEILSSLNLGQIHSPNALRLNAKTGYRLLHEQHFPTSVESRGYDHELVASDADAVVRYIKACDGSAREQLEGERLEHFKECLSQEIEIGKRRGRKGMPLTATSTLFLCHR